MTEIDWPMDGQRGYRRVQQVHEESELDRHGQEDGR